MIPAAAPPDRPRWEAFRTIGDWDVPDPLDVRDGGDDRPTEKESDCRFGRQRQRKRRSDLQNPTRCRIRYNFPISSRNTQNPGNRSYVRCSITLQYRSRYLRHGKDKCLTSCPSRSCRRVGLRCRSRCGSCSRRRPDSQDAASSRHISRAFGQSQRKRCCHSTD